MQDIRDDDGGAQLSKQRSQAASRLGVAGDFVRVAQLAKALGISANSIRAQIRRGVFPMRHRHLGDIVVVSLDDYVAWSNAAPPNVERARPPSKVDCGVGCEVQPSQAESGARIQETPKQRIERMKREVLASREARRAEH